MRSLIHALLAQYEDASSQCDGAESVLDNAHLQIVKSRSISVIDWSKSVFLKDESKHGGRDGETEIYLFGKQWNEDQRLKCHEMYARISLHVLCLVLMLVPTIASIDSSKTLSHQLP